MQMQEIMQFVTAHPVLSVAWIVLFVAVVVMTIKSRFSKVKEVSRGQAIHLINKEEAMVVDTRTRDEYRKGHIANAVNLTPSELKSGSLGELGKHKSQPMIVVCANGMTSRQSAEHLVNAGFTQVYSLKDGIAGWHGDNLPLARVK